MCCTSNARACGGIVYVSSPHAHADDHHTGIRIGTEQIPSMPLRHPVESVAPCLPFIGLENLSLFNGERWEQRKRLSHGYSTPL